MTDMFSLSEARMAQGDPFRAIPSETARNTNVGVVQSKATGNMFRFISALSARNASPIVSFNAITEKSSRSTRARAFFHVTELASLGRIRVLQAAPFTDIALEIVE